MKRRWNSGQQKLENECRTYLKEQKIFKRLLEGFWKKYESYGMFTGTIELRNLTEHEREELEGFFGKNFHGKKSASISAAKFRKAWESSRFGEISPEKVLEIYFDKKPEAKSEEKRLYEQMWKRILKESEEKAAGTHAAGWLRELREALEKSEKSDAQVCPLEIYSYLKKRYGESKDSEPEIRKQVSLVVRMINMLPYWNGNVEYQAVFAAKVTGNPHAFDRGEQDSTLLAFILDWFEKQNLPGKMTDTKEAGSAKEHIFPALQTQKRYLQAGILKDDLSNYTAVYGIRAWKKGGEMHQGMEGYLAEEESVQVSLASLTGWGQVECRGKQLFLVENPSVFSVLCGKWKGTRSCMCMNGQPRLSSLLLLDLLAGSGVRIYYAGDFDPEGLLIAQKLKQYYQGEFYFWHMASQDYDKAMSEKPISERRMKMLERITDSGLLPVVERMREEKRAGYQEKLINLYTGENRNGPEQRRQGESFHAW